MRMLGIDVEGLVEGPAGRQHPKLGVEDDEGLVDRVHDRLGQRLGVFNQRQLAHHDGKPSSIWRGHARLDRDRQTAPGRRCAKSNDCPAFARRSSPLIICWTLHDIATKVA